MNEKNTKYSRHSYCRDRIDALDQENLELNKKMHSDGEGRIDKSYVQALKRNNKEMYELRAEIRNMNSSAIKVQSLGRGYIARKSFSEREGNSTSQSVYCK